MSDGAMTARKANRLRLLMTELKEHPGRFSARELAEIDAMLGDLPPRNPKMTFRDYVTIANPEYRWWWHNETIARCCNDLLTGKIENLLVSLPPRHSKTMTISELFSSYYMYRYPFRRIGMASATDDLSNTMSSNSQTYFRRVLEAKTGIKMREQGAHRWDTNDGGYLWSTGIGGQATGKGGHMLILDDPLKNALESESAHVRKQRINWMESTWFTRAEPNVRRVMILTRWHEMDPAGWVLRQAELGGEYATKWHVVNMELIKTDEEYTVPEGCTLEYDPRPSWNGLPDHEEAVLCPDRVPMREAMRIKATTSVYFFNALYQGRPKPAEGTLIKVEWFTIMDAVPVDVAARVWFFDLAGTEARHGDGTTDPDYTAGVRMSKSKDGYFTIEAILHVRLRPGDRNVAMRAQLDRDAMAFAEHGPHDDPSPNMRAFRVGFEGETGVDGEDRTRSVQSALAGYVLDKPYRPRRDKEARVRSVSDTPFAESFQSQGQAGNLRMVKGSWNNVLLDELRSFPYGGHDDLVDAVTGAFEMLVSQTTFAPPDEIPGGEVKAPQPLSVGSSEPSSSWG